jgi:hypothetical protein
MNDSSPRSAFLPLTLVSASLLIILSWQIYLSLQTRSNARAQFEQRKQLVEQSTKVQGGLENLLNDLLTLAETDKDAKAVVDKYQIRRNAPPSAPK